MRFESISNVSERQDNLANISELMRKAQKGVNLSSSDEELDLRDEDNFFQKDLEQEF